MPSKEGVAKDAPDDASDHASDELTAHIVPNKMKAFDARLQGDLASYQGKVYFFFTTQ